MAGQGVKLCTASMPDLDPNPGPGPLGGGLNNSAKWFAVGPFHILALVIAMLVACGGASKSAETPQNSIYEGGRPTCPEFREVVKDTRQGFLGDAELLERLRSIQRQASTAEPGIRTASKALLDKATQGDARALAEATEAMVDACTEYAYWEQS